MPTARTAVRASLLASLALAAVATSAGARPASQSARSPLPNLVASSSADGSYTITNTGSVAAGSFKIVTFEYTGAIIDTLVVKGLPAGGSVHGTTGAGCLPIGVSADAKNKVAESNEKDNTVVVQGSGCS
jgi:hypothetical protein